jgi:hypothetical protein
MSAMADLSTAITDLAEGHGLDSRQAELVARYVGKPIAPHLHPTYTPANPMIAVAHLGFGQTDHIRKLMFEEHYQSFGWIQVEVRRCTDCQTVLPILAGGPAFEQPWRLDYFPRCSRHAF